MSPDRIDVLIVGAGPVGLFLANECVRRGLTFRIIEKNSGQSEHSKALAIFPRTLEIFDMAGVAGPFLEVANRCTSVVIVTPERTLARMQFEPEGTPYSFIAMVPQNVTERLLVEVLQQRGEQVEYDTAFVSAEQQEDAVSVTLNRQGATSTVRASFVVGCDGAHSQVRKALNLTLEGGEYADSFLLADVDTNQTLPADQLQLCPSEFGPLAIFPMNATRRRIVATIDQQEGETPSLDLVRRLLVQRAPHGIEALALHWSSYFRIHHRHAPKLQDGRMMIAGDAAHIHSPFGGQGMNTGLHDAWNLVWKLDLFLRGGGNLQLLSSYTSERLPVIRSVIETTDRLTKVMGTPNKFAQLLRNTMLPMLSRVAPFQHAFVQRLSELGIAYADSPIMEGPGKRYFDDSLRGGKGIASRFLLFVNEGDATARQSGQQLCDALPEIVELRKFAHPGMALVRPDGYEAYATHHAAKAADFESVRSLLAQQTDL